jgi:hypothetical protein
MLVYPTAFPSDSITSLVALVEGGTLLTNPQQAALDIWNVEGYALSIVVGSPAAPASSKGSKTVLNDKDAVAALKPLVAAPDEKSRLAITIDWAAIIQWLETLIADILGGLPIT